MYRMKPYPDNKPNESGYYMTYYHNITLDKNFYKALWYRVEEDKWIWRDEFTVLYFLPESRNDYYVPCEMWCNDKEITYKQE